MNLPAENHAPRKTSEDLDPGPPPIQFRLKTLLATMMLAAILFAVLSRVGGVWAAIVIWVSLLVAGHVLGNALGSRATAYVSGRRRRDEAPPIPAGQPVDARGAAAPTTTLGTNGALGMRLAMIVAGGGVCGSIIGTSLVWIHNDRTLAWPALGLAAFSSAIIGAFLCFLAASCLQVTAKAWRAAERHSTKQ
ncbi:MAG: hypothetical protein K8U03_11960 [Planctomycetia bacterium]|nr:hypothetical protein [Planctomycetia bacterium]